MKYDIDILGYESPVTLITQDIAKRVAQKQDDMILEAILKTEVVVDKDELIKAMQYDRDQYEKGYRNGYEAGYNANKWISVKDELPKPYKYALVYFDEHIEVDFMLDDRDWFNFFGAVTHWMPLPEPPKEVQNDG